MAYILLLTNNKSGLLGKPWLLFINNLKQLRRYNNIINTRLSCPSPHYSTNMHQLISRPSSGHYLHPLLINKKSRLLGKPWLLLPWLQALHFSFPFYGLCFYQAMIMNYINISQYDYVFVSVVAIYLSVSSPNPFSHGNQPPNSMYKQMIYPQEQC